MEARIPEGDRRPGLCYAVTDERLELPVIDLSHAAFAPETDDAEEDAANSATAAR